MRIRPASQRLPERTPPPVRACGTGGLFHLANYLFLPHGGHRLPHDARRAWASSPPWRRDARRERDARRDAPPSSTAAAPLATRANGTRPAIDSSPGRELPERMRLRPALLPLREEECGSFREYNPEGPQFALPRQPRAERLRQHQARLHSGPLDYSQPAARAREHHLEAAADRALTHRTPSPAWGPARVEPPSASPPHDSAWRGCAGRFPRLRPGCERPGSI